MKIRFKSSDPRAGMEVEFDSSRGQELIDAGAAVEVKAREDRVEEEAEVKPVKKAAKKAD